jgi:hypothetical protein
MNVKDFPQSYQAQILRQLSKTSSPTAMIHSVGSVCARVTNEVKQAKKERDSKPRPGIKAGEKREMNENERTYNRLYLDGKGIFEAMILKLPGGSRYTPDFITFDATGRMTAHEVKGAYKLQSQGRAATAFRECVAAFPGIVFVWATNDSGKNYNVQTFNSGLANDK